MIQPYIDCALPPAARDGIEPDDIAEIVCEVGEGTVHRLWEPLAEKQRPPNGYAAKFATPYCIAAPLFTAAVGLDAFTDAAVADPACARSPPRSATGSTPPIPTPRAYTGHIRARLADGRISRSASRTCAAAPASRSPAPRWRRSSPAMPASAAGTPPASPPYWQWCRSKSWAAPRIDLGELRS